MEGECATLLPVFVLIACASSRRAHSIMMVVVYGTCAVTLGMPTGVADGGVSWSNTPLRTDVTSLQYPYYSPEHVLPPQSGVISFNWWYLFIVLLGSGQLVGLQMTSRSSTSPQHQAGCAPMTHQSCCKHDCMQQAQRQHHEAPASHMCASHLVSQVSTAQAATLSQPPLVSTP